MIEVRIESFPPHLLATAHRGDYQGIGQVFERLTRSRSARG